MTNDPTSTSDYYVPTGGISSGTGNTIQRHQEGLPANTFFVYETKEVNGVLEIVNQDDDPKITEKDLIAYHTSMPNVTLGFQTRWEFYNFDLGFTLRSSLNNYVYNDVKATKLSALKSPEREGAYSNVMLHSLGLYEGIQGSSTITTDNAYKMDRLVENASFLRCDNITLGYTIKKTDLNARVYATVSNPFVISGYSGLDPEVFSGIDNNIYPRSMTVLLGVSLQF